MTAGNGKNYTVVHSFVIAGRGPVYAGPQRRDLAVVQCANPGRGELVGVCYCMRDVKEEEEDGYVRSKQLVSGICSAPPLDVAYRLA